MTSNSVEGEKLRKSLQKYDDIFVDIPYFTKEDIIKYTDELKECEYIFSTWYMPTFTEEEIESYFPSLKCIFYAAGTVKYFAIPFFKKGVRVFTAASANGIPVAEFTASQILLAGKGYFQSQRAYKWSFWRHSFYKSRGFAERKFGNYGAYVGIIGCGAIGSKVVEFLSHYNLHLYVYDPYISDEQIKKLGVKRCSLEFLFRECDVISNHLPDLPETRGLIDENLLKMMKPTATFINTARGLQVDEKALNKVLKKNKDMCALLDVTSHEPLFPWSPLYWRRNVFLTPHISGSLSGEYGRMVEFMVKAYFDVLKGKHNVCETSLEAVLKQSIH